MSAGVDVYRLCQTWLDDPLIDEQTKEELRSVLHDAGEIEDRFYKDLEFGTGGLRGVMGAGTNRMNIYTVGKATQGLADWLLGQAQSAAASATATANTQRPAAVIAFDSRQNSPEFALEAARVLAGNGIKVYLFESLRPTPELSFAVRYLRAAAGIVITASHNPPEYNGYKVYGSDGGQLVPDVAEEVIRSAANVKSLAQIRRADVAEAERSGLIERIGEEVDRAYLEAVRSVSVHPQAAAELGDRFQVVFTPLHGAGNIAVRRALEAIGCRNVHVVAEQEQPDGTFPTVKSPNPEEREAFKLALTEAERLDADMIIGTDPDCDRMGAIVRTASGAYEQLSGNQAGALLLHYLLEGHKYAGTLPANGAMIKTIVTGELGARIAEDYGLTVFNTLTGFKYIGEKMTEFARTGQHTFLFGYEESYGYLAGDHCRDKDAVVASMLICEAAAWYKKQGKTLLNVLDELYARYGVHLESLHSRTLVGKEGMERIARIMEWWRTSPPESAGGVRVSKVLDYADGLDGLPRENALKFELEDGSWFCLRPSGTEPKIKIYLAVRQSDMARAEAALERLELSVLGRLEPS